MQSMLVYAYNSMNERLYTKKQLMRSATRMITMNMFHRTWKLKPRCNYEDDVSFAVIIFRKLSRFFLNNLIIYVQNIVKKIR